MTCEPHWIIAQSPLFLLEGSRKGMKCTYIVVSVLGGPSLHLLDIFFHSKQQCPLFLFGLLLFKKVTMVVVSRSLDNKYPQFSIRCYCIMSHSLANDNKFSCSNSQYYNPMFRLLAEVLFWGQLSKDQGSSTHADDTRQQHV